MRAFFVGLAFLVLGLLLVVVLSALFVLFSPLFFVIGIALRIILSIAVVIFAVWLLGKVVILIWDSLKSKDADKEKSE